MKRIIVLSSKQGAGKTTTAAWMKSHLEWLDFEVKVFKFAGIIYELHDLCLPILKGYGILADSVVKDGNLLQVLGTEYGRKHFGEDIWVKMTRRSVTKWIASMPNRIAIIDDCRFPNELEAFQQDALLVRLECAEEERKRRCGAHWRDNTNHESETALDGHIHKFHKTIFTTSSSAKEVGMEILLLASKEYS